MPYFSQLSSVIAGVFECKKVAHYITGCYQHLYKPLMRIYFSEHPVAEDVEKDLQDQNSGKQEQNLEEQAVSIIVCRPAC